MSPIAYNLLPEGKQSAACQMCCPVKANNLHTDPCYRIMHAPASEFPKAWACMCWFLVLCHCKKKCEVSGCLSNCTIHMLLLILFYNEPPSYCISLANQEISISHHKATNPTWMLVHTLQRISGSGNRYHGSPTKVVRLGPTSHINPFPRVSYNPVAKFVFVLGCAKLMHDAPS